MAHPEHEQVRQRYDFRCGYCGVSETDSGGELTVDHHRPVSAGGDDGDDNLVYSCWRCNLYKSDFFPTPAEAARGHRILHPLRDDVALHVREDPVSYLLVPLTVTGATHVNLLQLNRPQLIEYRRRRFLQVRMAVRVELLETNDHRLRDLIRALERYILLLEQEAASDE